MSQSPAANGAEVVLALLRAYGVDCIFAAPIAVMAPFWEAIARQRADGAPETPRYLQCRHEGIAVSAAAGYYKATGRPQAVFLPTGLGVLHGAMALRTAYQDRVPMLVISPDTLTYGEVAATDPGPEWPSLLVDLHGPARDGEICVKWAKEAKTPGDLVNELRRALYVAEAVPRGPTLLSIPFDLLLAPVRLDAQPPLRAHPVAASGAQLDRVAAVLSAAAEPLIITEHGGRTAEERGALLGIAEALGAPIFEFMQPAHHNAPRNHPLVMLGPVEPVLERADAVLVAGANAPWHPPRQPLRAGCAVVHLEEDPLRPRAAYWGYRTTDTLAGDRRENLLGLLERVRQRRPAAAGARAARWAAYKAGALEAGRRAADGAAAQARDCVPAAALFRALHRALPGDAVIVDEIVAQTPQMLQFLFESQPFEQHRGWTGALGTALGTALGVKVARPSSPVVCVLGDGAFHFNPVPAAFGFAQEHGAPLLVVVCDNRGYASQTWNTRKYFPDGAAVGSGRFVGDVIAPTPEYAKLVEAYGGVGERVGGIATLDAAIDRALAALAGGRSALLDVLVTP